MVLVYKPSPIIRWRRNILRIHVNTILFVALLVYLIRDVYPLSTYTREPLDVSHGHATLLWAKVALLFLTAVVIPLTTPRMWTHSDSATTKSATPNPEQLACPLSLLLFSFLSPVVWKAYRVSHLSVNNLPPLADNDHAGWLKRRWFPSLEKYSSAFGRSLIWTIAWIFRWVWFEMGVAMIILAVGHLGSPVAVNGLLSYLETNSSSSSPTYPPNEVRPFVWILLLFFSPLLVTFSMEWYLRIALQLNVQLDALITQLVFEHALRIRVKPDPSTNVPSSKTVNSNVSKGDKSRASKPKGRKSGVKSQASLINNLVTTDLSNIAELRNWVMILFQRPVEFVLSVLFLERILGWVSTSVGIGLMVLLAPIPAKIINAGRKLFLERMRKTDVRVEVFGDVMAVLRMVKLFGWETKMSRRIADARNEELRVLKKRRLFLMGSDLVNYIVPLLSVTGCFATYTVFLHQTLTPSRVFSSLVVFERLQQIVKFMFVNLNRYYTGSVSVGRIEEFLGGTELIDAFEERESTSLSLSETFMQAEIIGFSNATFSWTKEEVNSFSGEVSLPSRQFFLRIADKVLFHQKCINLIVGPTGSGKTAMLLALLSEMHFIPTSTATSGPSGDSWYNLPRERGVAYAAQESWVLNETIRENILFHSPYEEDRYNKILYQCALEHDLSLFHAGDLTEVGEKGLTLSGGQKLRLTLARAVYSNAKVVLLDDVLAALDVHTSKWIVEKCFLGELMKDRTVILVTHNTALTLPIASFVVTMKDGQVFKQEVMHHAFTTTISPPPATADLVEVGVDIKASGDGSKLGGPDDQVEGPQDPDSKGKLIVDEEVQVGHVGWSAIMLYATGIGGKFPIIFFTTWLGSIVLSQLAVVCQTYYLGFWASQYEGMDPGEVNVALYVIRFLHPGIVILTVIINCCTTLNYVWGTTRASEYIHTRLVASILGSTMRWLDKTPVSRIITRSTQDINAVDVSITSSFRDFVDVCIRLLSRLGAVVLFSPIFLLPGFLLLVIGICIGSVYFKAQMSVKREMSIAKAPMLGHFGATISGLTSIRAYGAQEISILEMQTRTDRHSRIARIFNNLQRWMAVRINMLSAVFTSSLAWYLVYVLHQSASVTGFSLNMAELTITVSGVFLSLERIENYLTIEQEATPDVVGNPPAYWPASGDLRVEKLSARYSPDGPEVLHELSFHVRSGERIGVVGRTGSGKSSLTLSLLRCIYTSGDIFYDGLSINRVNLDALRSNITIIPQIPELISGSLRENLDPFEEHDDLMLNDALKSAGLQALQEDVAAKDRITLDTMISSGGNNFSLGQRQIIALARAIVRGSKLLILDEATSAIDYKTDGIIQSSLRNQLNVDVTLITIAHRLQTIMDADRIMVLDSGSIVEFDSPLALLEIPEGHLRALVDQSHDRDILVRIAQKSRV
ncbi:P-loop containing nucleoside triphosphate hydrolase protein [Lentinula aciculospora]|uniref:P-loop containing nucleoside triphosphate hydrolase protein n=1 Tax=Lentinula aciculospora TaxID=153920 RepID=A0A9W8ZT53_9AGAR|nr:P-loop containing nucleoside triphosphate hydrolase protein [Lentinula aciculospora]